MYNISVAIPTYNRKDYLIQTITHVLAQTIHNMEIIIFDNGGNYDISEAIKNIPIPSGSTLAIDRNEINIGNINNFRKIQTHNFNSPYLVVFHDDDTMRNDYLETAVDFLKNNLDVSWVGSNIRFTTDPALMDVFEITQHKGFKKMNKGSLLNLIFNNFNIGFPTVIYKTEAFKLADIKLLGEQFGKWFDRPLMVLAIGKGSVGVSTEKFLNYRIHPNQDSSGVNHNQDQEKILALFDFYKEQAYQIPSCIISYQQWAFNNSILSAQKFSSNIFEFIDFLKKIYKQKYFKLRHINLRGIYYFIRAIIKKINI